MKKHALWLAALLGSQTGSGWASSPGPELAPRPPPRTAAAYPLRQDGRVVYLYGAPATVICAPLNLCLIALEPGERIQRDGVHIGDAIRWRIKPAVGADDTTHVVVKPLASGLETDLALVTDRRTYHLRLISRQQGSMPLVAFNYPGAVNAAWQTYYRDRAEAAEQRRLPGTRDDLATLDFEYTVTGCPRCAWRPLRVYNDGQRTILQMGPGLRQGDVPALLVQTRQGETLVNYRIQGDRYIVDRVFERAWLVLGVGRRQDRVVVERRRGAGASEEVFAWAD